MLCVVGIIGEPMERPIAPKLRIGEWCVDAASGEILRDRDVAEPRTDPSSGSRLEARALRLLLCLAERPGEVVSIEELLDRVWPDVAVSSDSVYQAVASLRRLLGDDPKQPAYIATVPRLGYRMVAKVRPCGESRIESRVEPGTEASGDPAPERGSADSKRRPVAGMAIGSRIRVGLLWSAGVALLVVLVVVFAVHHKELNGGRVTVSANAAPPQRSVAVLPFLDLTDGMQQEEFADGMTEELIDRLSKVSGFRVPAPTASFYFKGKQVSVTEICKELGVAYVLDGSVRKSGSRLRVSARLVRGETGYVVWSETYDRPFGDKLMVQDDIAGEVTKALRATAELGAH